VVVCLLMRRLMLAACLVCAACTPTTETSAQSPGTSFVATPRVTPVSSAAAGATLSREPATLPVFPEEAAVVAALNSAGIPLTLIGASKFETLLGDRQRARVFIAAPGAGGAGADILFLERPINNVRVCASQAASGPRYDIFIGDRFVDSGEGQTAFYSISGRYFIQSFDKRFSDALMAGLGTVTPPC